VVSQAPNLNNIRRRGNSKKSSLYKGDFLFNIYSIFLLRKKLKNHYYFIFSIILFIPPCLSHRSFSEGGTCLAEDEKDYSPLKKVGDVIS